MTDATLTEAAPVDCETHAPVPIERWVEAILLAARHIGVSVSPELVRSASAWAARTDTEQAVIDIALSAGLVAQFVSIPIDNLAPHMVPALVQIGDKYVGVVVAMGSGVARVAFSVDGTTIERAVPFEQLRGGAGRFLLLHEREAVRDSRLDSYLSERPKSWLKGIFVSNSRTMIELGLGSLVGNLLAIGTSLFAMQVWDRVVPARSTNTLWVLASGVALALLLELLIRTARVSVADHFGKHADLKLSAMFFARVLDIRNDARPRSPGTLISQLRDLEQLRELLTSSTMGVLIDLPFVFAFLFIIWVLGGPLVLVPLAAIPLLILPGLLAQIPLAKLSNEGLSEAALRNAILMESIYRVEDIKILQAEPRFRTLWNTVNRVSGEIGLKQRYLAGLLVNFSQMVQQLAYVGVIIVGVYGILGGGLSFGAVLACSILTSRTIAPLGQISAVLGRIQNARVGKKGLDSLLALPVDHDPGKDAYHKPALVGRYRFENVAYAYGPEDKPALIIPQLKIEPGERIAILGRVGAGKSTLLRLCGGLATPVQGRVLFNETVMGLIDVADIRRDIGFVLQESSLFYGSLRENLLIGNPLASDEQILEAMRLASADQLLLNQPHGLDLKLRENGQGLSGGQKQALILARTFLRSPNILLLDEPTASLDEATELAIIERLKGWLGQRTLIVATHRYPVLSLVDRIIVIDGGRIVRDGPRDEILKVLTAGGPANPDSRGKPQPIQAAG
ncbi:type I secretion system permease/ATPase [Rhizobium mesoamericanum]|uniref:type I secretion system permease/ATPase n=1 Tax=Rhizobium mesoamericanum TaxID=1079800 RepID=UPI00040D4751|nr:type I secretion system permease/ATPase [Rhizobium mesoamericanum]